MYAYPIHPPTRWAPSHQQQAAMPWPYPPGYPFHGQPIDNRSSGAALFREPAWRYTPAAFQMPTHIPLPSTIPYLPAHSPPAMPAWRTHQPQQWQPALLNPMSTGSGHATDRSTLKMEQDHSYDAVNSGGVQALPVATITAAEFEALLRAEKRTIVDIPRPVEEVSVTVAAPEVVLDLEPAGMVDEIIKSEIEDSGICVVEDLLCEEELEEIQWREDAMEKPKIKDGAVEQKEAPRGMSQPMPLVRGYFKFRPWSTPVAKHRQCSDDAPIPVAGSSGQRSYNGTKRKLMIRSQRPLACEEPPPLPLAPSDSFVLTIFRACCESVQWPCTAIHPQGGQ